MENMNQSSGTSNVRDTLTILFKHKYLIAITFVVVAIATSVYALMIRSTYEAKSTLLVKYGREYQPRPEDAGTRQAPAITPQTVINGEISILTSLDLYSRLVNKMGAVSIYPDLANMPEGNLTAENMAIRKLMKDIVVKNLPNSSLIEVSYTHSNPEMVAHVINQLVDLFKEKHLEIFSGEGTEFLETELGKSQEQLSRSESELATFKQQHGVFSYEEQKTALIGQRTQIDTETKTAQALVAQLEQRVAFIKSPKWTVDVSSELKSQLAALEQREAQLMEKYNANSRTMQSQQQEIKAAKDAIQRGNEEQRRIELGKVDGELTVARTRLDTLRRQLGSIDGEIRTLDARERDLRNLRREASLNEQNYQTYAKKLQESMISDEMDRRKMVAISVIEKAPIFRIPKEQKFSKGQLVGLGLGGGIAAGIALAFLLEFMSPAMTTPMSAERRLGIPVMVAITRKV